MSEIDIRPTEPKDIRALQTVLDETGLFPGDLLPGMMSGYFGEGSQDISLTCHLDGRPVGLCYARPEQLADRVWNMLLLAVRPAQHGAGLGTQLIVALELMLRDRGQRILLVETSGTDAFEPTRAFYEKNGFEHEGRIRDFWADGDDKVILRKRLQAG